MSLGDYLERRRLRIDRTLERVLRREPGPDRTLVAAMQYAVTAGGKRLRPLIAIAACEACGEASHAIDTPAAALELIHTYSLIHDDLPAMDDDDLRRGRPTLHKVYSEAVAILAGDALQTLAFELLGTYPEGREHAARRASAVAMVARRSGVAGMIGGQIGDLEAEGRDPDADRLAWIHQHKTGALFAASAELGGIVAGADDDSLSALSRFGEALGHGFQIADDILDRTETADELGKTPGKDQRAEKATYPALVGLERSREAAERWLAQACAGLERFGPPAEPLRALARLAVSRKT